MKIEYKEISKLATIQTKKLFEAIDRKNLRSILLALKELSDLHKAVEKISATTARSGK